MPDQVEIRLRELAADLRVEVPPGLEAAVAARIVEERVPTRRWRRWLVGLLVALLGAGVVASPVGASVREWLGFHGVAVLEDGTSVTEEPTVPAEPDGTTLEGAAALAGFTPLVPQELGDPDGVTVSDDGLVVSLTWGTGDDTVRLDQFRGQVDPVFWKHVDVAEHVTLAGGDALWIASPHDVTVVADDGTRRRLEPRLAAPTLVWPRGELTLRLEGDLTLARASEIADSAM